MADPSWLIPPPSGGSSECFTSPTRGSAETAFRLDSESQEDREGPQLTSSEGSRGGTRFPREPSPCAYVVLLGLSSRGVIRRGNLPGTAPQWPRLLHERQESRREEQRHHVEPDIAGRDAARRVSVRDAQAGQLFRPAPGADRCPVQLQGSHDEEHPGISRSRT